MSDNNALVIGGSGGIAQALIKQLSDDKHYAQVYVVSRSSSVPANLADTPEITWVTLDSLDSQAVEQQVEAWQSDNLSFSLIINTIGVLHSDTLKPEKRLEDIDTESLSRYFQINTITNAQWLKYAPKIVDQQAAAYVALSARVGSIQDNQLGGWYGYRASKAALNMLMKTASIEYKRRSKNTRLVCYHPGTVDTGLSKPFQSNVKPGKLFTPEFTASQLLSHLPSLGLEPNIHYIDWEGEPIQW